METPLHAKGRKAENGTFLFWPIQVKQNCKIQSVFLQCNIMIALCVNSYILILSIRVIPLEYIHNAYLH